MKMIVSPQTAFLYAKQNYNTFPNNWFVSNHISWNEAFKNEKKEYHCPPLDIFNKIQKTAAEFEKALIQLGYENCVVNVHCFYRCDKHNQELLDKYNNAIKKHLPPPNGKPAMHSSHLYGMALDFDIVGITVQKVKDDLVKLIKAGKVHMRIEKNTTTWVHLDIGNPYINDYVWKEY